MPDLGRPTRPGDVAPPLNFAEYFLGTCEVDERVGPAHLADALRLRQILGNFLSNAIKFTAKGVVEVALEWRGGVAADPQHPRGADLLSFRVTDTGVGVDAQAQQRLFQP